MKRLLYLVLLLPIGIALIVLSVANRQDVMLRLDPFNDINPALSLELPFFAFLFAALLLGMIIGGIAVWFGQGRHRKEARRERGQARRWRDEAEANRDALCGLLEQWDIARLDGGGSMAGPGYGCEVRARDDRSLGHGMCVR